MILVGVGDLRPLLQLRHLVTACLDCLLSAGFVRCGLSFLKACFGTLRIGFCDSVHVHDTYVSVLRGLCGMELFLWLLALYCTV